MSDQNAMMLNPLQLAHVGDTVWEMLVRSRLAFAGRSVRHMHRDAVSGVNAGAQAKALDRIREQLTEPEAELVRRGRNAHAHHPTPKNQDPADYRSATGLEALMGYLYLTGRDERAVELFALSQEITEEENHA